MLYKIYIAQFLNQNMKANIRILIIGVPTKPHRMLKCSLACYAKEYENTFIPFNKCLYQLTAIESEYQLYRRTSLF